MNYTQGFSALNERSFRIYWASTLATYAASQMDTMLKGWLIYKMTGSATNLGLVTLAAGVPMVIMSFFGGAIADRVDKQKTLLGTQVISTGVAIALTALLILNLLQFWHFIAFSIVQGCTFALIAPLRQSMVPRLVRPEHLVSAISLTSSSFNLMGIAGPAAAGLLLTFMAPEQVYFIVVFFFITGAALIAAVRSPGGTSAPTQALHLDIIEGFRYITGDSRIRILMVMAFVVSLFCSPYIYMMPALAIGTLKLDQQGLGFLLAASGVGALIGSLATGFLATMKKRGMFMLGLIAAYGCAVALAAQFQSLWLAMLMILLASVSATTLATLNNSVLLLTTPSTLHGRVISVFTMIMALIPIGALPMGSVADAIGIPVTFLAAGLIAILFALILWLFVPTIRKV